ncbi:MAG TPA: FAD-dependent oxidoreductase [Micromonosporaceae bacterium]|nr:FAD-dependent oxidoreductase [Micromonosporaceae bacterium]
MPDYRGLSHWMATVDDDLTPRPSLAADIDADVVIVGAGLTGLWTAYYLATADPTMRIAVVESEIAGFGASGRNGGWCSALFPQSIGALARQHGPELAVAMHEAMRHTVDEVGRITAREGIECDFAKGGTVMLARSPLQLERARDEVRESDEFGLGLVMLGADEARRRCGATAVVGGTYTPDCARIHPAKLVRGLTRAVERRGVTVYERSPVVRLAPREVATPYATVRADIVVRATEGYTARLPGLRRAIAPVYSLMVVTQPLPTSFWDVAGLGQRETFGDYRNLIIYGQRTADDRLAFGGRGAPYHFGSQIRPDYDRDARVFGDLRRVLAQLFPDLQVDGVVPINMAWGGPLGIPRDWCASVGLDRATGLAWAGGYVGDGVSTTNLAGRTLADLIRDEQTDLTVLPWVNHRSGSWEPEPLRWLGVNAALWAMGGADRTEARTGRSSKRAALINRLVGH